MRPDFVTDTQQRSDPRHPLRSQAEALSHWARHLPPADRALLEQFQAHGRTTRQIADLGGRSCRQVRQRTVTLIKRLQSKEFRFVASFPHKLPPDYLPVAQACFVQGLSLRQTAKRTGRTIYQVRLTRQIIRDLIRLAHR